MLATTIKGTTMKATMKRIPHAGWFAVLVVAASAATAEERVVMSLPRLGDATTHRIVGVDAARREVRLTRVDGPGAGFSIPSEGQAILVVRSRRGGPVDTAVRVSIGEILDDGTIVASFGPGAAEVVAEGPAILGRPLSGDIGRGPVKPATTVDMKALPDVIGPKSKAEGAAADPVAAARAAARRQQSMNNLRQIGLAFHNYHDAYNHFPPAAVIGPDGRPWHSWRVLILPFLGGDEHDLWKRYDFSQPWDSPKNLALAEKAPKVFQDPAVGAKDGSTHYAVLVGPATLFPPESNGTMKDAGDSSAINASGQRFTAVTDGTSNTLLAVTADPARKTPWTKPEDVAFDGDAAVIGAPGGFASLHVAGTTKVGLGLLADGSVRLIPDSLDADIFAALASRNGGEVVDDEAMAVAGGDEPGNALRAVRIVAGADGTLHVIP